MKYIFAIDETGSFNLPFASESEKEKSFVCGVQIKGNELELKQSYQQIYKECFPELPIPNKTEEILKTKDIKDNARFHFCKMSDEQKKILKRVLLPFVAKIYISKDEPLLYANNQNWWLISVETVIREYLRDLNLQKGDEVKIMIDNRSEKVWGTDKKEDFTQYHDILKQQILYNVQKYIPDNKLEIEFKSDTSSFIINLADIVCGFVRTDKKSLKDIKQEKCSCKNIYNNLDPVVCMDTNPLLSLNIIYQEVSVDKFDNIKYTSDILELLRRDDDNYNMAWDIFYNFLKSEISERKTNSSVIKIRTFVDYFLEEFERGLITNKFESGIDLKIMVLFVEYFSHIGDISHIGDRNNLFDRSFFEKQLEKTNDKSETRVLRKWEKMISYTLHENQIYFNAYNFSEKISTTTDIWVRHENILKLLGGISKKDEPTAALIGTLGQAYAFEDDFDNAIDYFEIAKDYAIKSESRTHSDLFNIYHRQKNIEKCREHFEFCCKNTPERYYKEKKYNNTWNLLLYCKLRALELYVNGRTMLPAMKLTELKNYNTEYPFPLVMKWESVALWLENGDTDKDIIEKYFTDALNNLLDKNNGFAIRTLALPIVQCYALINNQNPFYAKYDNYLAEFIRQSEHFKAFVSKKPILENIKNKEDIWERAMSLPFYYA